MSLSSKDIEREVISKISRPVFGSNFQELELNKAATS
jgi:hypothetical protein